MSQHGHSDPAGPGPPQRPPEVPDEPLVLGEGDGVRTLGCHAPSMRQLMETDADELHVSYSAMQSGWQEQSAPSPAYAAAPGEDADLLRVLGGGGPAAAGTLSRWYRAKVGAAALRRIPVVGQFELQTHY